MKPTTATGITIEVDDDHLSAFLKLDPAHELPELTADALLNALRETKVDITPHVRTRVEKICEGHATGTLKDAQVLIAQGRDPQPPTDARFELAETLPRESNTPPEEPAETEADDEVPVDYYSQCRLITADEGEIVGKIIPVVQGIAGVDVFGNPIPVTSTPREVELADGVRLDEDDVTIRATTTGVVRSKDNRVGVVDVAKINGDVDFESGSIDVECDVIVKGTVRDLFHVKTTKSLSVGGAIENCQIEVGGDVGVQGGIAGRETGKVTAGGAIVCKFCESSTLDAQGDITITNETINANLRTMSQLEVPRGAIIGGTAYARGGAEVRVIGSDADVPTRVTIGLDPIVLAKAARIGREIEKRKQSAEKIRTAVGPLMANLKRLAPDQKERATELMFQADTIEADSAELDAQKTQSITDGSWHAEPILLVLDCIHPGTTLIFEDFEYIVQREIIRGPVKIFKRRAGDGLPSGLVSVNQVSGSRRELPCRAYEAELPDENESDEVSNAPKSGA